jgi:phytoene synthase
MDTYTKFSYTASRDLTLTYSTSFGISSRLFSKSIRRHIYAIYGLVRIADEIVDTYPGTDRREQLDSFEAETYTAMHSGYSTNPIIHAFSLTAREYTIEKKFITAFFKSMRMDLEPKLYTQALYKTYIYGSAEVIGLMCLRIFCNKDETLYDSLESGAKALGAAYQKINFLRDLGADYKELGRLYFPGLTFDSFNDKTKQTIIKDIRKDIASASDSLIRLPKSSRVAVSTSLTYYVKLLDKLSRLPASEIKKKRVRINNTHKLLLLGSTMLHERVTKII